MRIKKQLERDMQQSIEDEPVVEVIDEDEDDVLIRPPSRHRRRILAEESD